MINDAPDQPLNDPRSLPAYTRHQTAELFGVSVNTISNWLNEGRFRLGNGEPVAWQENTGLREWFIVASAVHRLAAQIGLGGGGHTAVNVHQLADVTVYTVVYDESANPFTQE